ncbi:MAG: hypothetical protein J6W12_05135 [Bacteroidales bacterium]|jgi:hypothetical protein|nr:hypothetical protein [Bacteroidales bacterium]MBQ7533293.1 hypothetical protein [Bacteroidales bacterium]
MNNKNLTIINIALALIALLLVYLIYKSISEPVVFENIRKERELEVVQNLKDIRSTQTLFKQTYNRYTADFDSLIDYIKTGKLPVVNIVADPNDTTFTKTINDTVGYIAVADSLFRNRENFNVESLRYVPYSENEKVQFELQAGYITRGGLKVAVFEAKTPYWVYLWDLDPQRVNNLRAEQEDLDKYAGLKVGSMDEPSLNGNWE